MSRAFQRGDRVAPIGPYREQWGDITGTVTHLHGDSPADGNPDPFLATDESDVWVTWDQPAQVKECWMAVDNLEKVG